MIVFFAAIREILKREIYRGDKKISLRDENKEQGKMDGCQLLTNHEFGSSGLWMRNCVRLISKKSQSMRGEYELRTRKLLRAMPVISSLTFAVDGFYG
ncbi:MAG: hypothetical protein DMG96_00330 [Acidobacteria bacterium]|nr:MAG: hypothetical protein DMG98_06655 [Acidobacteriota bacterium]PYV80597.1 MAG: hypothetical protein DMG96_00330 [Acidobacteriota bacterium]